MELLQSTTWNFILQMEVVTFYWLHSPFLCTQTFFLVVTKKEFLLAWVSAIRTAETIVIVGNTFTQIILGLICHRATIFIAGELDRSTKMSFTLSTTQIPKSMTWIQTNGRLVFILQLLLGKLPVLSNT